MKVAIVGGSGFIGSRLSNLFKKNNINFIILDKRKSDDFPNEWLYYDVTKPDTMVTPLDGVDIIVNLAAEHKDNVLPIELYYDVNVDGAKNLCTVADKLGIKHIVFTSSVAVYGFVDSDTDESGDFNPFNHYGKSKLAAEKIYNNWYENDNKKLLTVIRPTVVFGEGNRGNVYNLFKQIAQGNFLMIGSGENQKSMAYVENVVAFIMHSLNFESGYHLFNYVDKPDFNMNELISTIYNSLNRKRKVIKVPYFLGLCGGYAFDLLSKCTGKEFSVSSIRVRKFCARTQFSSSNIERTEFLAPVTLKSAVENTIKHEFL